MPVVKLFEFLVSSLCLFMVEEEFEKEQRELDLFMLGAPAGVRSQVRIKLVTCWHRHPACSYPCP
jgi:hypothetical protein